MGSACSSDSEAKVKPSAPKVSNVKDDQPRETHAHRFETIRDNFESTEEVSAALRKAGLEASDLIVAVDLTWSNERSGTLTFHGQCLHSTAVSMNPYKSVMSIICKTLRAFDDDQLIPMYGFGSDTTRDHSLLTFSPDGSSIHTLENVLKSYDANIAKIDLSGPTSFAPAIYKAIEIVKQSGGQYHILVIIADGRVSPQCMKPTTDALIEASNYPLSIIMVGVGDGPFDTMREFDDELTTRIWDNFQFVNFTEIGQRAEKLKYSAAKWEADFALMALMEIPDQYALIIKLGLLGNSRPERPATSVKVLNLQGKHATFQLPPKTSGSKNYPTLTYPSAPQP